MSTKWNLLVDIGKCNGCYNCFISAKDEYVGNSAHGYFAPQPSQGHAWIDVKLVERGTVPATQASYLLRTCNHCDDAPCIKAALDGAVTKRADGIVIIDPVKAKGQRQIVDACPYQAVWWNDELELPQAWPFDAHLLDQGWQKPRCVQVCATGALRSLKLTDAEMANVATQEGLQVLNPEFGTRPRIWYKNLARINSVFVAGTVEVDTGDRRDCLAGARVTLSSSDSIIAECRTDDFGDFCLDGLVPDGEIHTLMIETATTSSTQEVVLHKSCYLGRIVVLA